MSVDMLQDEPSNAIFERRVFRGKEGRLFEVNVTVVMFGFRVRTGRLDDKMQCMVYDADICAGASQEMLELIYALIAKVVEKNGTSRIVWPTFDVKPVWKDPRFMRSLCDLAGVDDLKSFEATFDLKPVSLMRAAMLTSFFSKENGESMG